MCAKGSHRQYRGPDGPRAPGCRRCSAMPLGCGSKKLLPLSVLLQFPYWTEIHAGELYIKHLYICVYAYVCVCVCLKQQESLLVSKPSTCLLHDGLTVTAACGPSAREGPVGRCSATTTRLAPGVASRLGALSWLAGGCWRAMSEGAGRVVREFSNDKRTRNSFSALPLGALGSWRPMTWNWAYALICIVSPQLSQP